MLPRLLSLAIMALSITCHAGSRLGDFEAAATTVPPPSGYHQPRHHSDDNNNFLTELLFGAAFDVIVFAGRHSHLRMQSEPYVFPDSSDATDYWNFPVDHRLAGEPLLPIFKLESAYWYEDHDLDGTTARLEVGYGCIGFQLNNSYFRESHPTDEMNLTSWHILYRMSLASSFELDVGLGTASLQGENENSGSSVTMAVRFHPYKNWGIEYRPEWIGINGNRLTDIDLGFYYHFNHGSLIAGYRWWETKYTTLEGPYVGFAIRF